MAEPLDFFAPNFAQAPGMDLAVETVTAGAKMGHESAIPHGRGIE
jgi:hypothetical protein